MTLKINLGGESTSSGGSKKKSSIGIGGGSDALNQVDAMINGPGMPSGGGNDGPGLLAGIRDLIFGRPSLPGDPTDPKNQQSATTDVSQNGGTPASGQTGISEDPNQPAGRKKGILGQVVDAIGGLF